MAEANYTILIEKLEEFIRKYYKNLLLKGVLYTTASVLIFYLSVVVLEYFGHFNSTVRTLLFYSFLLTTLYLLTRFIFIPLFKMYKIGATISYEQASEIIGTHFSEVQDKLLNVLQLKKIANETTSELIEASIQQKITQLRPVPFASAIDFSKNRKYLKYVVPPLLLFIVIGISAPHIVADGTSRLVNHSVYYEKQAPFRFIINNEKLETMQQEDFLLNIQLEGEAIPKEVFIEINENQYRLKKENTILFHYLFKNIQRDTKFRLFADEFYSKEYELTALPNPIILNFEVQLHYPAYIRKKDETIINTGDIILPEGTKVNWKFKTKDTDQIQMVFNDSTFSTVQMEEDVYTYSQRFLKSASYTIATQNKYIKNNESIHYVLNIIPDLYPSIEVEEKKDTIYPKQIYFSGLAKDDYGFKRITFNYQFIDSPDSNNRNAGIVSSEISVQPQTTHQQFFYYWNIQPMLIKAGEKIEYFFEVWDNDGVNGSKSTRSQKRIFKAPTLDELEKQGEKSNEQIKEELQESILKAKQLQKNLKEIDKKMLEKKQLDWQEKKQIQELLEQQKELQKKVENIKQQHSENINKQNEYKKVDEKILEKQQQLEKLFEQIMTDEMKKLFEELEQLMEKMDKEKLQDMIEQMKLSDKDIEKELDRTLELFKQLEFEQKLQETKEKLEKLAEQQEKLSEETQEKNANQEDLKEKQENLNKQFEDIKKNLEDLENKNSELQHPNQMPNTEQEEKTIKEEMQKSSEDLQKKNNKKASQSQKKASEEMQKMNEKLAQMQESMQMESQSEDIDALRGLLENLIQLSFDQEDLMENLKNTQINDPKYNQLTQQQKKLKDDAKMIEDTLFALSKRIVQLEAVVNREIASINSNMDKAISFLSDQPPNRAAEYINKAVSRQQYTMTSINNLALLLDEVVQQMQQQMSEQKFGNASCNKPGKSKNCNKSSMNELQKQLNEQIKKLKEQMGKKEGEKPGKRDGQKLSEQLAKLAAQQEAIRNELRKASEQLNKEGNFQGKNSLEKLSKLMEETETDLVNKRITQETINRQQEILTKLLEHEKAEREREMEEKRESKEVKNHDIRNPSDFFEYNKLKQKEVELLKTIPLSLQPFYKNKVNEYFNNYK